ncbi:DUF72 domain-containing protein [Pedobacter nutrimenti]|uniref:Uncharacterized protein YecE (DUF72 family) n=1 Tax=Pedobacter nutrimenti TaxID=1241337 RepID=A0A318U7H5_9SPHI|nr:DUF72 domain-containing protein [Pedobacter nutrimenti]PYF68482.1 uncharacterized protein YecE (DUF72 family) [Pedobacter nutrimenti]
MEFGKVQEDEILSVNFSLPNDGSITSKILEKSEENKKVKFYVGCGTWGQKSWTKHLYNKGTKTSDFLKMYLTQFNSIELNAMFYSLPDRDRVIGWKKLAIENSKSNFLFCPRLPQLISHVLKLEDVNEIFQNFVDVVSNFGDNLGASFLQLGIFGPERLHILQDFVETVPSGFKLFVEVRSPEWFSNEKVKEEYFSVLSRNNIGAVITDTSGRRDLIHMNLTIPECFIRFVGNGGKYVESDFRRIDDWVIRIQEWVNRGIEKVYFFVHEHGERNTPILANYVIQQFNALLEANLPELTFIEK